MARRNNGKKTSGGDLSTRNDGFMETGTGKGTTSDKVSRISPSPVYISPGLARQWYLSNGFIQTVVDAPAEDALQGMDHHKNKSGQ